LGFTWDVVVDAYCAEVVGRGAQVAEQPANRPYGIREFVVRDINGIEIVVGQDIDDD